MKIRDDSLVITAGKWYSPKASLAYFLRYIVFKSYKALDKPLTVKVNSFTLLCLMPCRGVLVESVLDSFSWVCMCVLVAQSCLTFHDPVDCSPPGSSVHGILQGRILEWVGILFSRGSSWPRDETCVSRVSCIGRSANYYWYYHYYHSMPQQHI